MQMMYGKSYEAKKILCKKSKRPFPKEVAESVEDGEDLFQVLFAENIKEIKQKAKEAPSSEKNKTTIENDSVDTVSWKECDLTTENSCNKAKCYSSKNKAREPKFFNTNGKKTFKTKSNLDDSWSRFLENDSYDELLDSKAVFKTLNSIKNKIKDSSSSSCPSVNSCNEARSIIYEESDPHLLKFSLEKEHPKEEKLCSTPLNRRNCVNDSWSHLSPIQPFLAKYCIVNGKCRRSDGKDNIEDKISDGVPVSQFGKMTIKSKSNKSSETNGQESTSGKLSDNNASSLKYETLREQNISSISLSKSESPDIFGNSEGELDAELVSFHRTDKKHFSSCGTKNMNNSCISVKLECELSDDSSLKKSSSESSHSKCFLKSPHYELHSPDPFESTSGSIENVSDLCSRTLIESSNCKRKPSDIFVDSSNNFERGYSEVSSKVKSEGDSSQMKTVDPTTSESFSNNLKNRSTEQIKDFNIPLSVNCRRLHKPKLCVVAESLDIGEETIKKGEVNNSLNSTRPRFTLRKSHVVVPLEFCYTVEKKRLTGFREAHVLLNSSFKEPKLSLESNESVLDDNNLKDPSSFKDLVLERCGQSDVMKFSEVLTESSLNTCVKVGEGAYGEVFSRCLPDGRKTVLKIIPIEGTCKINGEVQKQFQEVLSEIVITLELSNLRNGENSCTSNFPELIGCYCVQGQYPSRLLQQWVDFYEEKTSENDCPDILPDDQIYIILELANVGTALEGFIFSSAVQAFSAFKQVAFALAVAERSLEFEHRDLHWGNILIQSSTTKKFNCILDGKEYCFSNSGIQASIIDFTLSRMTFEGCCVFNDLSADPALFEGTGDYQFDVYRLMKDTVNDKWQVFEPYTNVLWLSYVLDKLVTEVYYRNKTSKAHKKGLKSLRDVRGEILQYKSAIDLVKSF